MSYTNSRRAIPEQNPFIYECEERRKELGLTRAQLSAKAFGGCSAYYCYYSGNRNMSGTSMKKLADALDMKLVICLTER